MSKIRSLQQKLVRGDLSATELTQAYLDAIARDGQTLNAYISTTPELALETAAKVDAKLRAGETLAPLEGVPMALKDNICTQGVRTTCASRMLDNYVPIYNATVWELLRAQNTPMLGKCNMDEFAMGSTCENSYIGGAKNPHDLSRVAGGSSGGSASAVAGGLAAWALGSDTGGSIRQPASFCGLVGLKPTYGAVSRYGLVAFASSLDQIGPLATCVEDAALVFDAISQRDARDMTSQGAREPALPRLHDGVRGKRIGLADEFFDGAQPDVVQAVTAGAKLLEAQGAELVKVSFPRLKYALPVYYILACAEASSNLSRYDGIRYGTSVNTANGLDDMICRSRSEGFGAEVKRRILLGTFVLSSGYFDAYYHKARLLRESLIRELERDVFAHCDMLLTPTVPMTALKSGQALSTVGTYLTDICTVSANIAGLPALSIPCGKDGEGLPVGLQLIGKHFEDAQLLAAGYTFETASAGSFLTSLEMGCRL